MSAPRGKALPHHIEKALCHLSGLGSIAMEPLIEGSIITDLLRQKVLVSAVHVWSA